MKEIGNTLIFSVTIAMEGSKRKELEKELSEKTGKQVIVLTPQIQFIGIA